MASAACEQNEILLKKGYSWSREETLLLISLYEEKKEMFQNVNYKKKQVWEVIAAIMQAESVESDHNSQTGNERRECPFYKELSEVYGYRPNVRPYATASSSGQGDSLRCPENDSAKSEKSAAMMSRKEHLKQAQLRRNVRQWQAALRRPRNHGWALVDETNVLHGLRTMQSRNVSSRRLSEKRLKNTTEIKWSCSLASWVS
ncbi:unnamed protein product [Porites lobata]|uniref:Myb/SANT-like DNA-binding domain-containing protein n=1 Tax=Porites lobata TaxID=104759 RepID=A0ABN8NTP1_9CNID|nr:unnamed protein product [Porites lobata]